MQWRAKSINNLSSLCHYYFGLCGIVKTILKQSLWRKHMRTMIAGVIALCWCGLSLAQDQPTADAKARAERLKAIQSEMTQATAAARQKVNELKDAAEKRTAQQALMRTMNELRPKLAEKALALAKENPKDDVGLDALIYANSMGAGSAGGIQEQARRLIIENHLSNPRIEDVILVLARRGRDYDEALLKKVLAQNSSKTVKATVSFILAQRLKSEAEGAKIKDADIVPKMKEAMTAFEKVSAEYGDLTLKAMRGKVADLAKREMDLLSKSPIGKVTPEIEGEDVDGTSFKISDYRGKVILLDFWGHW